MKADFSLVLEGLNLTVSDISIGNYDRSKLEIYSKGSSVFSSDEESPEMSSPYVVAFAEPGIYWIKLTISSSLAPDVTYSASNFILVEDSKNTSLSHSSIITLVMEILPKNFDLDYQLFTSLKSKWCSMVGPGLVPTKRNIFDENNYSFLGKYLLAHLILRDLFLKAGNNFLMSTFSAAQDLSSSAGSQGAVKKITSGPIETEWFSGDDTLKTVFGTSGVYEQVLSTLGSLASSLGVYLSFLPNNPAHTFVPILIKQDPPNAQIRPVSVG